MIRIPILTLVLASAVSLAMPAYASDGLTEEQRIDLVRNLTSEYATLKESLPRSKKPLDFDASGKYDQAKWAAIIRQNGPAGRLGDQIQITKVTIERERLVFDINGGVKGSGHWYDHVQVGMGGATNPIGQGGSPTAASGTYLALEFHKPLADLDSAAVKKLLSPIFDFEKRSASQVYSEQLPPEIKKAIADKRAQAGMDRDQVLLALGRPDHKSRETKDGDEIEDWIYGHPPGKITFVTFNGEKCVKVKETYAGLGAEAAAPLDVPR